MSVHGIKETKEALEFALLLRKVVSEIIKEGKPSFGQLLLLPKIAISGLAAVKGANLILVEASDLQPEEVDELIAIAKPMLEDVTPDNLEPLMWEMIASVKKLAESFGLIK